VPAFTNGTTNTWPIVLYSAVRFGLTPAVNALATIYDHVLRAQGLRRGQGADQENQRAHCAKAERHGKHDDDLPDQQPALSRWQRLRGDPGGRCGD